jgi:hypothetical protein
MQEITKKLYGKPKVLWQKFYGKSSCPDDFPRGKLPETADFVGHKKTPTL